MLTRVFPCLLCLFITVYSLLKLSGKNILRKTFNPIILFYLLYIIINTFSATLHNDSFILNWTLWKNFEILTACLWSIWLYYVFLMYGHKQIFHNLLKLVNYFFVILGVFSIYSFLQENSLTNLILYIRPSLEMPIINPIMLSLIAVFILVYSVLNLKKTRYQLLYFIFILLGITLLLIAKSRTGYFIAIFYSVFYSYYFNNFSTKIKTYILFFVTIVLASIYSQYLEFSRLGDAFSDGFGGRISKSETRFENTSWGESLIFIEQNLFFGQGNLNYQRFINSKNYSVDNSILQFLLASGIIGGTLIISYLFFILPAKIHKFFKKHKFNPSSKLVLLLILIAYFRSMTTNGFSTYGFELLFLLLSYSFIKYMNDAKKII